MGRSGAGTSTVFSLWAAAVVSVGAAEYVFRVSDAPLDPGERWELRATNFFTWGVRSFVLARGEQVEDAVLVVSQARYRPAPGGFNLLRFYLLDSAENPLNWLPDEGRFPRGRLRQYRKDASGPTGIAALTWTSKVEIGTHAKPESERRPEVLRWSLAELGLLPVFQTFLANGNNFGLAMDPEGDFGSPDVRFVLITRDPVMPPVATMPPVVPRVQPDPVRMPDGGSTLALVLTVLGGGLVWWWVRRR
jgi:hypothetical protein